MKNEFLYQRVWKEKPGYHFKTDAPYFGPYVYIKEKQVDGFLRYCERYGYEKKVLSKRRAFRIRWERGQTFTSGGFSFREILDKN